MTRRKKAGHKYKRKRFVLGKRHEKEEVIISKKRNTFNWREFWETANPIRETVNVPGGVSETA